MPQRPPPLPPAVPRGPAAPPAADPLAGFARPLALTRLAMTVERGLRAFWPLLSFLALVFVALAFRVQDLLAPRGASVAAGLGAFLAALALGYGLRGFRRPSPAEALARLDAALPGRPLSALGDTMALGQADPASRALWAAHQARMALAAAAARAPLPNPDLAPRDPFALRLTALTALSVALIFGAPLAVFEPAARPRAPGSAEAAMGPSWEGWAEPPRYTGKPGLYLNTFESAEVFLPEGTQIRMRFYGAPEALPFSETVSSPAAAADPAADPAAGTGQAQGSAGVWARDFEVRRSGVIEIGGVLGRRLSVVMLSDDPPSVSLPRPAERRADGKLAQPFQAADDYGIVRGQARIALNLEAVDRRYGLAVAPEPREEMVFDLPLPISGSRAEFDETLVEDAAQHVWANLPVRLTLEVEDGLGQNGRSEAQAFDLPGRRFFDPRAAALIELRRDLLWSRVNAPRAAQLLRALTHRPEGLFPAPEMAPALRGLAAQIDTGNLSPEVRDTVAKALWDMAELLEDGGLADALAAMQQAQERLSEAIRNGASKDEIAKLMAELKEASDRYLEMLAERSQQEEEGPQFGQKQESQHITGDQIQAMMDEIQRLMEEGRMAEAQELLDQLARMMENMRVTQGQGGEGELPGGKAMKDLGKTLREQQDLSDEAFRDLQQRPETGRAGPGTQAPQDGAHDGAQDGAQPGQGADRGAGGGEETRQGLAERQHALRRELERQRGLMPRLGGEAAEGAQRALDEASRAMEGAEEALRDGDLSGAIDRQADAITALRDGMRNLGEAMAEESGQGQRGQGTQGQERMGDATGGRGLREMPRDPLGRETGEGGRIGSNGPLAQGDDVYRRARDLLDEIRRRTAERLRPEAERDYLRRLLDRF